MSAATITVCSLGVSNGGQTSTMSAPIICRQLNSARCGTFSPSMPRRIVRSSRDVQPPLSGVPVPGATVSNIINSVTVNWIQNVDINRKIHRLLSHSLVNLLDNPIGANPPVSPIFTGMYSSISSLVTYVNPTSLSCLKSSSSFPKIGHRNPTCYHQPSHPHKCHSPYSNSV